ncbi:MAG TPA: cation:proton antiporter, partial [Ilumatobacteraceae bacterium]
MLSAAEPIDLARILLDLLIVLAAARLAGEVAERVRIPAVLGEIAAGIVIGPSVSGLVRLDGGRGVSISVLAELGVLLLLVQVGMEMDLGELRKVGGASLIVATIGVILPFAGGAAISAGLGHDAKTSIFIGAALTATSVGITARVFGDLHALATVEARVVIGAAVADDVLGLIILTVVVKVVAGGSVGVGTVAGTLGIAVAFLVIVGGLGLTLLPRALDLLHAKARSGATVVVAAIVAVLGFAELADAAKLAFIIGAFLAGLAIGRSRHHERIADQFSAVGNVLIPVFFVQIGIDADIAAMARPKVLLLALLLTVVGVVGKIAAGWGAIGTRADRFLVGIGMIPRGEVGLIFASIGLSSGVLDSDLYGALLVVILATTVITPPALRLRIGARGAPPSLEIASSEPPSDGWLLVVDGEIALTATPPAAAAAEVALLAASWLDRGRPSEELLDWFARHRSEPLVWDPDDTTALVGLLQSSTSEAWRLLEVTAILERALPEVAGAMHVRRSDIRELDPLSALRFPVVEGLHELDDPNALHDDVVLAGFVTDVCLRTTSNQRGDLECAARLLGRLTNPPLAEQLTELISDAFMLREAAQHWSSFAEAEMLQLATHIAEPAQARSARALARAILRRNDRDEQPLLELTWRIIDLLDHPDISGPGAANLAEARLAAAQRLAVSTEVSERLRHSPITYLLSSDPEELARQARLLEPLPKAGIVRVAVTPDPTPELWRIDVAARDTDSLLARLAGALADSE